jgi:hypothetical protein
MGAAREKDQADFDLERFVDMFDEAMTSNDPRVIETLRKLLMIVSLTRPESQTEHSRRDGPLRRLFDDMNNLNRRMNRMEEETSERRRAWDNQDKYSMQAAAQMAQGIDDDVMRQLSKSTAMAINGGVWPKEKL